MGERRVPGVRGGAGPRRRVRWGEAAWAGAWLVGGLLIGRGSALSGIAALAPALALGAVGARRAPESPWDARAPRGRWCATLLPWAVALAAAAGFASAGTARGTVAMLALVLLPVAVAERLPASAASRAALLGALCAGFALLALPTGPGLALAAAAAFQGAVGAAMGAVTAGLDARWRGAPLGETPPADVWGPLAGALGVGACAAGLGGWLGGAGAAALVAGYTLWRAVGPGEGALAGAVAGGVCMSALGNGLLAPGVAGLAGAVAGLCRAYGRGAAALGYGATTLGALALGVAPDWAWSLGAAVGAGGWALGRFGPARGLGPEPTARSAPPPPAFAERLGVAARTCMELSRGLAELPLLGGSGMVEAERALRLAEEVCPGCPALAACWERKLPRARQMVADLWRRAQEAPAVWQDVGGADTILCLRPREMAEAANRLAALGRQRQEFLRLLAASRHSAIAPLVGIGRALADLAEEAAAAREQHGAAHADLAAEEPRAPIQERWIGKSAPGCFGFEVTAAALPRPGLSVSGDSLRCRLLPGDRLALAVSDGMGSGGSAAVASASAVEHLLANLAAGLSAEAALRQTNEHLLGDSAAERFATLELVIAHLRTGTGEWYAMGAPPGLLVHARGVREWGGGGLPAGILSGPEIRSGRTRLRAGDVLVLLSDGLLDRGGPAVGGRGPRARWAAEWVRERKDQAAGSSPTLALGLVAAARQMGTPGDHDDLTVVCCLLRPPSTEAEAAPLPPSWRRPPPPSRAAAQASGPAGTGATESAAEGSAAAGRAATSGAEASAAAGSRAATSADGGVGWISPGVSGVGGERDGGATLGTGDTSRAGVPPLAAG